MAKKRSGCYSFAVLLVPLALISAVAFAQFSSQPIDPCRIPPYPAFAVRDEETAHLVIAIRFNGSGTVSDCKVEEGAAASRLADYAVKYIYRYWNISPNRAGQTLHLDVNYPGTAPFDIGRPPYFGRSLPLIDYPYFAKSTLEQGSMLIKIKFNERGYPVRCETDQFSAPRELVTYASRFIMANWCDPELAGLTANLPVEFRLHPRNPIEARFR